MKSKGFIETRGLVAAIEAADAMVKQSAQKSWRSFANSIRISQPSVVLNKPIKK